MSTRSLATNSHCLHMSKSVNLHLTSSPSSVLCSFNAAEEENSREQDKQERARESEEEEGASASVASAGASLE